MQDKFFDINIIPDIPNNIVKTIDENLKDISNNYKLLTDDSLKILKISLENSIVKPLTLYNLFFLVEIYLKFYLIKYSRLTINEIENQGHDILSLINFANEVDKKVKFDKLKFLLQEFKDKNNKRLEMHKYYDFKYNRKKREETLIFNFKYEDIELNKIKEVIEWISCHI